MSTTEILDVAVVGGGASGVYSAWRLITHKSKKKDPQKIALFELSHRIGGRLVSVTPPGMPHIRCELGGMRYMSSHTYVAGLVQNKLKLPVVEMPVDEPDNIAYLRGKRLRLKDLTDPEKVPYNVDWHERGQNPGSLVADAIHQLVPGSEKFTAQDWLEAQKTVVFEGKPLHDHGFWNMLAQVLSSEGYFFAQDASGYDSLASNWNAANAMPFNMGDFGVAAKYYRLVDGYEQVPLTLLKLFEEAGGKTYLGYRLKSFDSVKLPDNTTGVQIKFEVETASKPGKRGGKVQAATQEITILARNLILAMPRRSLELIDQTGAVLDEKNAEVHQLIQSVHPIPLFKIFVCYHTPWWQATGVSQGRTVTDLPVRQCYYWGTEGDQNGADKNNRNSV
ncbi:MAG: FAD-dependent oxidoreductase, partial [Anaerolineae bacterium]|nr:FAD-dependent oxidoreductase [Anaerolineae bacterium]